MFNITFTFDRFLSCVCQNSKFAPNSIWPLKGWQTQTEQNRIKNLKKNTANWWPRVQRTIYHLSYVDCSFSHCIIAFSDSFSRQSRRSSWLSTLFVNSLWHFINMILEIGNGSVIFFFPSLFIYLVSVLFLSFNFPRGLMPIPSTNNLTKRD